MEGGNRAEAERWLYTANKLLSARDLHGARSFAIRARECDPRFEVTELLLTVIDTLVAGEARINDLVDWYSILQVIRYSHNLDYIAAQYRRLAAILDPHRNPFAFSAYAFSLVNDAWSVLSNPSKKAIFDNDLRLLTVVVVEEEEEEERPSQDNVTQLTEPTRPARATESIETELNGAFWTACPYCYGLFEYPKVYEECTLLCQSCRRPFHALAVRSPPELTGKDGFMSFCSWGFMPLGFSGDFKDISGSASQWNPFSALVPCPLKGADRWRHLRGPWAYYDDEAAAAFVERRGAGNLGKLDLNVEFSNDVEETANGVRDRANAGGPGNAEDNIEGIGFFEGLDEFLSSLPILNAVADDKVKGH
ncbi:hypothetical protein Ahy_A10g050854 isoform B [Arachis hypogaea]|uniref:J domain-containing protein n=1 Tax=Arachis hypogaea TaxID=3818 RepID=A0A445BAQ7_ARAHY|nr:hypothetical protein Ahy_A10g050854 isoform B [Arachis hypogaea]